MDNNEGSTHIDLLDEHYWTADELLFYEDGNEVVDRGLHGIINDTYHNAFSTTALRKLLLT